MQVEAHQIVICVGEAEFLDDVARRLVAGGRRAEAVQKIGEQKHNRPAAQHVVQIGHRGRDVRAAMFRFEREQFADNAQDVAAAFARGHK